MNCKLGNIVAIPSPYCKLPFWVEMVVQFIYEYGSIRCFYISFTYW